MSGQNFASGSHAAEAGAEHPHGRIGFRHVHRRSNNDPSIIVPTLQTAQGCLRAAAIVLAAVTGVHAQANGPTVIKGHYTEQHSLMEGDSGPVTWTREFTITLSGKGAIHEEWSGRNNHNLQKSKNGDYTLGETAGSVAWHVLGANMLQKSINFRQHTLTFTIRTSGKACHLDAVFRLKPGFTDMYAPHADNGEWTHFSLPRTLEAECEII
jgi:hypothetical protein